jgi:hypothetical protein
MIAQLLNQPFLVGQAELARDGLIEAVARKSRRRGTGQLDEFGKDELEALQAELEAAIAAEHASKPAAGRAKDDLAFVPRDPTLSMLQTAIDEAVHLHRPDAIETRQLPDGRRRGSTQPAVTSTVLKGMPIATTPAGRRQFEVRRPRLFSDPGYLLSGLATIRRAFMSPTQFNDSPGGPVEVADRARIVVVGDWGSGLERAGNVGKRIEAAIRDAHADRREVHVIHLGDVYYSGWKGEYKKRFLDPWPVQRGSTDVGSYTLNGNHDMYSGGKGYFETCLTDPRFSRQEGSSYFSLRNANWQLLALDTSYDDKALHGGQVSWATREIETHSNLKTVLLSHHQLFSAYESAGSLLATQLRPLLAKGGINGWLWGHEHRCLIYSPSEGVGFSSCVGHGGIPEYLIAKEGEPLPKPLKYDYRKVWGDGTEPWNTFGFVYLDLTDATCELTYVDEDGDPHERAAIS